MTTFNDIYDRAIFRFSDYDFMKIDVQSRTDILEKYLMSAIPDVAIVVGEDKLKYDLYQCCFLEDISDEIQELLALGVDYYWFSSKAQNSELLRNSLSTKDWTFFSPANLMRELRNVRNDVRGEYESKIVKYSYNHGDFSKLGTGG